MTEPDDRSHHTARHEMVALVRDQTHIALQCHTLAMHAKEIVFKAQEDLQWVPDEVHDELEAHLRRIRNEFEALDRKWSDFAPDGFLEKIREREGSQ